MTDAEPKTFLYADLQGTKAEKIAWIYNRMIREHGEDPDSEHMKVFQKHIQALRLMEKIVQDYVARGQIIDYHLPNVPEQKPGSKRIGFQEFPDVSY